MSAPEWTKPYIALQHDDGTWYVPWNNRMNAERHREDVRHWFRVTVQVRRLSNEHGDWETTR